MFYAELLQTFNGWHLLSLYTQKYYDPALTTLKFCFPLICLFSKFSHLSLHRIYTRAIRNLHILHGGIIPSHLADKTLCISFLNFKEVVLSVNVLLPVKTKQNNQTKTTKERKVCDLKNIMDKWRLVQNIPLEGLRIDTGFLLFQLNPPTLLLSKAYCWGTGFLQDHILWIRSKWNTELL